MQDIIFSIFPCEKSIIRQIFSNKQLESPWVKFSPMKIQIIFIYVRSRMVLKPPTILKISTRQVLKSELYQKPGKWTW